ncbi:MAG: glutamate-1-semialdehyde 2,1-aminomutase [Candidatus Bathyarchaeota archaeon]|nr:glutamate-1-semialdehyde 2,1-aminomutase [Candidatus Bathyarchaeota archaeon]MDH5532052.1 glutamate-1-semialdehyde 2,1-aminomutase [Candidatus Bathyarchaeota archaeon]MDH5713319.1 glutamate-1-semialdehyde 2,1-aminomutase [Candidatus Bathyarchaeota archaeon]
MKNPEATYIRRTPTSKKLWQKAQQHIPGGITANVKHYNPYPIFMKKAKGSKLYDVDDNEYIDYCLCYGPLILGHGHPTVTKAIKKQLDQKGTTTYGTPNEIETKMAKKIKQHVPCAKMIRFTNSGLEATLHAIRTARAHTKKPKIAKFEGHYHGAYDQVTISITPPLSQAGPNQAPIPVSNSAGLPRHILENTVVLPFNDLPNTEKLIKKHKNQLAAIIVEPVARGFIAPDIDFLKGLRTLTEENQIVLIFDEIMTGFRLGLGGAQKHFGVTPDMVALGKIIGGGLPAGAFAGKPEIMKVTSPLGSKHPYDHLFHSGTFSGCPIVLAAGLATIEELEKPRTYNHINWIAEEVKKCMNDVFDDYNIAAQAIGLGSMFQCLFTSQKRIRNYRDTAKADAQRRVNFDLELINNGVYVRPHKPFHTSLVHTKADLDKTFEAIKEATKTVAK